MQSVVIAYALTMAMLIPASGWVADRFGTRRAFFSAIAAGYQRDQFAALAVIGDTEGPIAPCGACRQVIIELGGPALPIRLGNLHGAVRDTTAREQLPDAFYL